jgi:GTP cyclohydrolase I
MGPMADRPETGRDEVVRELHPQTRVDRARIAEAMRSVLAAIGEDPDRNGLARTPQRVADMYAEIFSGLHRDPVDELDVVFDECHDEMIMVRDIPLYSMCEHHLIPFVGRAHVAYIPNTRGQITGLSKLARLVDVLARRPQVQERLTTQIADAIEQALEPRGVFVVIEAEHLCMSMRGVRKSGSQTVTSAVRGYFRTNEATRSEAMNLIGPR